jgi:hypothetical protein
MKKLIETVVDNLVSESHGEHSGERIAKSIDRDHKSVSDDNGGHTNVYHQGTEKNAKDDFHGAHKYHVETPDDDYEMHVLPTAKGKVSVRTRLARHEDGDHFKPQVTHDVNDHPKHIAAAFAKHWEDGAGA